VNELIADDFAFFVEGDLGNVAFRHFQIANAFGVGGVHGTNLRTETFTEVFETCADGQTVIRESRLRTTVNDLEEQLAHSGVDSVANEVGVERFKNGLAGKYLCCHSCGVSHTGATDSFYESLLDYAVLNVKGEFASALLRCAPAYTVCKSGDIGNFLCLYPFAFFGNGSGTVVRTLGNYTHMLDFF
jgi:hypothetical protein